MPVTPFPGDQLGLTLSDAAKLLRKMTKSFNTRREILALHSGASAIEAFDRLEEPADAAQRALSARHQRAYLISGREMGVLIELLEQHQETLSVDQVRRLSFDPADLVTDLKGKRIVQVVALIDDTH